MHKDGNIVVWRVTAESEVLDAEPMLGSED
jgi:hypothetical protein